jgi:hypothetical protein
VTNYQGVDNHEDRYRFLLAGLVALERSKVSEGLRPAYSNESCFPRRQDWGGTANRLFPNGLRPIIDYLNVALVICEGGSI